MVQKKKALAGATISPTHAATQHNPTQTPSSTTTCLHIFTYSSQNTTSNPTVHISTTSTHTNLLDQKPITPLTTSSIPHHNPYLVRSMLASSCGFTTVILPIRSQTTHTPSTRLHLEKVPAFLLFFIFYEVMIPGLTWEGQFRDWADLVRLR